MNIAIILASGKSKRMGCYECPKQFLEVRNLPLFLYSTMTFENNSLVDQIVIVTNVEHVEKVKALCSKHNISKLSKVVSGGETRKDSVKNGLDALEAKDDDIILIHDSARPLVSDKIITKNIEACREFGAVETAIAPIDTVVFKKEDIIDSIPNRSELLLGQTPQTFKYAIIRKAHEQNLAGVEVTDDCKLVAMLGYPIHFVEGHRSNFKVTYKEDIAIMEAYLNALEK